MCGPCRADDVAREEARLPRGRRAAGTAGRPRAEAGPRSVPPANLKYRLAAGEPPVRGNWRLVTSAGAVMPVGILTG